MSYHASGVTGSLRDSAPSPACTSRCDVVSRWQPRALASLISVCIASSFACTEPAERVRVLVLIDADDSVRALVDDVQVVIEAQHVNNRGWLIVQSPRFEPNATSDWPLETRVDPGGGEQNYLVTATARDERGAVVAEARALRDWKDLDKPNIFLRFEEACIRRMELCPKGETCHAGDCVSARYEAARDAPREPSGTTITLTLPYRVEVG